jgi:large subunit ribosomal protein L4
MQLPVLNKEGQETGKSVTLPESAFGIEPNDHAIYLAVKQYLANQRQGTHKAKERAEIKGSTKKIKRQKGTGTARAGSLKSPIFRTGGRVFGPRPRNYEVKLNKKVKRLARNSALSYKAKEENITVFEDFSFDAPKTKNFISVLKSLKADDGKTLVVLGENNPNVHLSARNLPQSKVITLDSLNVYDVLNADKLILAESAVEKLNA